MSVSNKKNMTTRGRAIYPPYLDLFNFKQSQNLATNLPHSEDYFYAKFHAIWCSRWKVIGVHTFWGFIFISNFIAICSVVFEIP